MTSLIYTRLITRNIHVTLIIKSFDQHSQSLFHLCIITYGVLVLYSLRLNTYTTAISTAVIRGSGLNPLFYSLADLSTCCSSSITGHMYINACITSPSHLHVSMCVYVCVCVCVTCVCVCIMIYIYLCMYVCLCIYIHMQGRLSALQTTYKIMDWMLLPLLLFGKVYVYIHTHAFKLQYYSLNPAKLLLPLLLLLLISTAKGSV